MLRLLELRVLPSARAGVSGLRFVPAARVAQKLAFPTVATVATERAEPRLPRPEGVGLVIANGSRVSIEYTLTLDDGSTADTNVGGEPLVYTHGEGEILEALEQALSGLGVDDERVVRLSAGEGYGEVDPEAFARVEPEAIPHDARHVGAMLVAQDPDGEQRAVRVVQVAAEEIVVDFNHPLAGQALNFAVRILAVE